ncbi:unnamed protein product [Mycetohabitans rhizoxinica HKI 454]|uniref:Uncharacterized protein n=1 Tax=Mycetohabitans rhizoxinica (strain DSM 19002 / CIP 109453 / HKI 454) TaxID=882378 RepID=E5AP79_MYCRK|nr:unnamed protein product [Mycetohabitans rhizoxinica HKI 454]
MDPGAVVSTPRVSLQVTACRGDGPVALTQRGPWTQLGRRAAAADGTAAAAMAPPSQSS